MKHHLDAPFMKVKAKRYCRSSKKEASRIAGSVCRKHAALHVNLLVFHNIDESMDSPRIADILSTQVDSLC
jgi:hypothetical protein